MNAQKKLQAFNLVDADGQEFIGSAKEVFEQLKSSSIPYKDSELDVYIVKCIIPNAKEYNGIDLGEFSGNFDELLTKIIDAGLLVEK